MGGRCGKARLQLVLRNRGYWVPQDSGHWVLCSRPSKGPQKAPRCSGTHTDPLMSLTQQSLGTGVCRLVRGAEHHMRSLTTPPDPASIEQSSRHPCTAAERAGQADLKPGFGVLFRPAPSESRSPTSCFREASSCCATEFMEPNANSWKKYKSP